MSRRIPLATFLVAVLFALVAVLPFFADDKKDDKKDDGFVPMFNGKDLTGWVNVNCAPGTFFVKDGEIITTGKPTGYLRTDKQYENFIADFEWMHVPPKPGASAIAASSSGPTRCPPSAPATRAASRCRCSSTSLQEQEGRNHRDQSGRPLQHPGRDVHARPAAPPRLGALPALGEPLQGRRRVEPLPRRGERRRHQAGGQRQGRLRREQVQAAQGLPRAWSRKAPSAISAT